MLRSVRIVSTENGLKTTGFYLIADIFNISISVDRVRLCIFEFVFVFNTELILRKLLIKSERRKEAWSSVEEEHFNLFFAFRVFLEFERDSRVRRGFQLSVESHPELLWFCFPSFRDWFKKARATCLTNQMQN